MARKIVTGVVLLCLSACNRPERSLLPYAETTVRQWRYETPTLDGVPIEIKDRFVIGFTLRQ